jgi:hypothetical protein
MIGYFTPASVLLSEAQSKNELVTPLKKPAKMMFFSIGRNCLFCCRLLCNQLICEQIKAVKIA